MRAELKFKLHKPLIIPLQYNHIVQAMIFKWINDESYRKFIHDTGYKYNNRVFKMYTFSRLQGKYSINKENSTITFEDEMKLLISTVDRKFLMYIVDGIIRNKEINIIGNKIELGEVLCYEKNIKSGANIFTKSPITVYSTFENELSKKTYYYSPYENDFSELIRKNLIKKYNALFNKNPENDEFIIIPSQRKKPKKSVITYKGTIIKAWNGEFIIKGSNELISMAYDAGLGSKNGQGFGCIELCDNYKLR